MDDRSLAKIAGCFSILSALCILVAIPIGISLNTGGPSAIDFGNPETLDRLRAAMPGMLLVEVLALAGPTLALAAGLGWHQMLRRDGSYVTLGVLLWYVGMLFVVLQDAIEFSLVEFLPAAHASAEAALKPGLLAAGAVLGRVIEVLTLLGDCVSGFGLALVNIALLRRTGSWRLLGGAGLLSTALTTAGLLLPQLGIARLLGFVIFMAWLITMGIVMLRWRSPATAPVFQTR
jgi:hypothetical protein